MAPATVTDVAGVKASTGVIVAPAVVLPTVMVVNTIPVIAGAFRAIDVTSLVVLDFI